MRLKVHPKGRITIPKEFREKIGVREGDYVETELEESTRTVVVRPLPEDWLTDLLQVLAEAHRGRSTTQVMRELRAGWEE